MMRIVVVGAGAIGGFIAAALARSHTDVAVVARGAHAEAIARDGVRVESDLGRFTSRVHVVEDPEELRDFDAALLTFKAHQWPNFMHLLAPLKNAKTTIVTLQNGVPFWYVREPPLRSVDPEGRIGAMFPDDRIVGGVVHVSGTIVEPGHVRQSGGLRYVFGDPNGGTGERCREIVARFTAAGLAPEVDPDIRRTIWLKLVNNVGLNATSVLERLTIKQMLASPDVRDRVRRLMVETLDVGRAMHAIDSADVDARIEYAARLSDVKTSMLQDFERGREMEIDPILGAVCELGERYGVPMPAVREAYEALR
jgi:2-dehydropantoate 2-reductase